MHLSRDRRNQRIYVASWTIFAVVIGLYIIAVPILHLPVLVAALALAPIPGIALIVLCFKIRSAGFGIRGRFHLESGETIVRTVPMHLSGPLSDEEYIVTVECFFHELQSTGHRFPEGHGRLIETLQPPNRKHTRLIVQGTFQMGDGAMLARAVSCPLSTRIDGTNVRDVRDAILHDLRTTGHHFPEGVGMLIEVRRAMFS